MADLALRRNHSVDHKFTAAARVRAAGLCGGEHALISGVAAAWWWGLDVRPPEEVEVVIPPNEHRRSRDGVRIVRRVVSAADRAWVRAAPVTSLPLSVMLASVALGQEGSSLMDRALQTKLTMAALRSAHYRNLGIRGSATAGRLIRAATDRAAAASERLFIGMLREAGIRGWRVNHPWNPDDRWSTVDVAFVVELLAIEIDGWAWHHSPDRFQRDRNKQNDLILGGMDSSAVHLVRPDQRAGSRHSESPERPGPCPAPPMINVSGHLMLQRDFRWPETLINRFPRPCHESSLAGRGHSFGLTRPRAA